MKKVTVAEQGIESLFGPLDENLRAIERGLGVTISARGRELQLEGPEPAVQAATNLIEQLSGLLEKGNRLQAEDVHAAIRIVHEEESVRLEDYFLHSRIRPGRRRVVSARSRRQRQYIEEIRGSDLVIGIGPAGTGKTYLAVALATEALTEKQVDRIILTRPAVEAGERLGFLPGDIVQKVDPYLRPLYDALYDFLEPAHSQDLIQRGVIEVAPLAFMRGRTLNDSFVILDEAQNTTPEQMKMFLTRVGFRCKTVITGDITQIDLAPGRTSGLVEARDVLDGIAGIRFVYFDERDVVRHPLVRSIIRAYENYRNGAARPDSGGPAPGEPRPAEPGAGPGGRVPGAPGVQGGP